MALLQSMSVAWLAHAVRSILDMTVLWQCYDAFCLGVILGILYHNCSGGLLLQSKQFMNHAMFRYGLIRTKARHATERACRAFDEHVAASQPSCNPVCHATEQVVAAMPQASLALLVEIQRKFDVSTKVALLMLAMLGSEITWACPIKSIWQSTP